MFLHEAGKNPTRRAASATPQAPQEQVSSDPEEDPPGDAAEDPSVRLEEARRLAEEGAGAEAERAFRDAIELAEAEENTVLQRAALRVVVQHLDGGGDLNAGAGGQGAAAPPPAAGDDMTRNRRRALRTAKRLRVDFGVENLFDKRYVEHTGGVNRVAGSAVAVDHTVVVVIVTTLTLARAAAPAGRAGGKASSAV